MLVATSSKANQLLVLTYVGHVSLKDLVRARENLHALLAELSPGFRVLADYTALETMAPDCLPEIGRIMEALDKIGVSMAVRVMPHPNKDPGINILTHFHYRRPPKVVTCDNLLDAINALSL
jgi:hypothetical protein